MTCFRSLVGTITFLFLFSQIVIVQPEDEADTKRTMPLDGYLELAGYAGEMSRVVDAAQQDESKIQMGSIQTLKKPRFLCLHGYGSNAASFEEQFNVWPKFVTDKMDFVFINGPFPLNDSTPVNERFEWVTLDKGTYKNFDESVAYIEDSMVEFGPFDGILGFSQGSFVAGALPGMQEQGVCLTRVGKIKHVVLISGAKFGVRLFPMPKLAETAYDSPINIPSLHIFGENDIAKPTAIELLEAYVDPLVIYHHGGHEVPKLDSMGNIKDALGRWRKKVGEATKKAEDLAGNTWQHLKTAPSFTDAALGRIAQGTKVLAEGGYEKIFRQTFETVPEELFQNSYACYLSTSAGPVMGVLYVSTAKLAFCSDNPLTYKDGDKTEWSYYKVIIPFQQLKAVNPSSSRANTSEKYIQVVSVDSHEFWFMGFLNYDGAVKCLQDAQQTHITRSIV